MRYALDVALAGDRVEPALRAYNNLAALLSAEGLQREAADTAEAFAELARRVGDVNGMAQATAWQAGGLVALGEWDHALELAESTSADDAARLGGEMLESNVVTISLLRGEVEHPRGERPPP